MYLALLFLFLATTNSAIPDSHEHCTGYLVNTTDVSPTVQYNASIIMTVLFNSSNQSKPYSVIWYSTVLDQHTDVTDRVTVVASGDPYDTYRTSFTIQHLTNDNQGRYTLYVCNKPLQYFFISFDDPECDDNSPPNANGIAPSTYIGPVGINHTLTCFFQGDTSSFDSQVEWNCSDDVITSSNYKHIMRPIFNSKSCSFLSSLTLIDVTSTDSSECQCYAVSVDGRKVGKKQSSINTFIDYPSVLENPVTGHGTYSSHDVLELKWRVSGTAASNNHYILPLVSINGTYLNISTCNCLLYFEEDTLLSSLSYLVFRVNKIQEISGRRGHTILLIEVYLKFRPIVSNVDSYNNLYANHSSITAVSIRYRPIWLILSYSIGGGGVIALLLLIAICLTVCCCKHRKNRHSIDYERLVNFPEELVDPREEPPTPAWDGEEEEPHVISPEQEATQQASHSLPEEDNNPERMVICSSSSQHSSQSSRGATPLRSHDHLVVATTHITGASPIHRTQEQVAPLISRPPKVRVSVSDEEDDVEKDAPIILPSHKPYKVFALYCNESSDGASAECFAYQVYSFIRMLQLFSNKSSGNYHYHCTADVLVEPCDTATITNWSNWTDLKIREATHVIIVCTPQLFDSLHRSTGTTFMMYRGPVGSDVVSNLLMDRENGCKFIPVFLNSCFRRDLVPTALRTRRCYTLHVDAMLHDLNITDNNIGDEKKITDYLKTHAEMSDFLDLIRLLTNKEWT